VSQRGGARADLLLLVPKVISVNGAATLHLKNALIHGVLSMFTYQKLREERTIA